jgi:serine/threonine-protein kinase
VPLPTRPTSLGPYEVVAKIAEGGMATIYLGRASDGPGRYRVAALKVIRHDFGHDETYRKMFLDEAKLLGLLSHPNIAAVYECGIDDQAHFIAMELMVGQTLAAVWEACRAKKLHIRVEHAAWIGARVAEGLHHAHELTDERGEPLRLIHRDVNPSNIFLTYGGEVKLFDFGLAKARGRRHKSHAGIVKGKLPYLTPEVVLQQPIDRRTDIYTLGATLWELTTMHRLFQRDSDVDTVAAVRAGLVPDPRARLAKYPEPLWLILRRALARDAADRYPTAAELARDLDTFVAAEGGAEDMELRTSGILDALFPGDREKRGQWLRYADATRAQRASVPPPPPPKSRRMPPPPPHKA